MAKKQLNAIFSRTNPLKLLGFLSENPGREFIGAEIQAKLKLRRTGLYLAANELADSGLINITTRGKMRFYSFNMMDPEARQFKVLRNISMLRPLIKSLREATKKSCSMAARAGARMTSRAISTCSYSHTIRMKLKG
ncbi:MAG: hypothetical protein LLG37_09430 [Spirochaetia bacterium]|nr:hypothetical protein [Spirochaetia bacterium]